MSSAGIVVATPICVLFLSLLGTQGTRLEHGDGCVAVHLRLAKLRAEIMEVEQEAEECSPTVTPDAPHLPSPEEVFASVGDVDKEHNGSTRGEKGAPARHTRA